MRQVTHWVDYENQIQFAIDQLRKYGTEPIIRSKIKNGRKTTLIALFRADMKGEGSTSQFN